MGNISQQRQAFTEQVIRESAYSAVLQVLTEYGLEKLTVGRVAKAADLATGTLYNYFKDKDDLLIYAAVRMFDTLYQRQAAAVGRAKSPVKNLQALVETTFEFFSANLSFFQFLDQAQVYCKIDMPVKHDHVDKEVRLLAGIIGDGIEKGDFKAVNPEKTAIFFHRAMVGTLCVNTELGPFDPVKESNSLVKMFRSFLS